MISYVSANLLFLCPITPRYVLTLWGHSYISKLAPPAPFPRLKRQSKGVFSGLSAALDALDLGDVFGQSQQSPDDNDQSLFDQGEGNVDQLETMIQQSNEQVWIFFTVRIGNVVST